MSLLEISIVLHSRKVIYVVVVVVVVFVCLFVSLFTSSCLQNTPCTPGVATISDSAVSDTRTLGFPIRLS